MIPDSALKNINICGTRHLNWDQSHRRQTPSSYAISPAPLICFIFLNTSGYFVHNDRSEYLPNALPHKDLIIDSLVFCNKSLLDQVIELNDTF